MVDPGFTYLACRHSSSGTHFLTVIGQAAPFPPHDPCGACFFYLSSTLVLCTVLHTARSHEVQQTSQGRGEESSNCSFSFSGLLHLFASISFFFFFFLGERTQRIASPQSEKDSPKDDQWAVCLSTSRHLPKIIIPFPRLWANPPMVRGLYDYSPCYRLQSYFAHVAILETVVQQQ